MVRITNVFVRFYNELFVYLYTFLRLFCLLLPICPKCTTFICFLQFFHFQIFSSKQQKCRLHSIYLLCCSQTDPYTKSDLHFMWQYLFMQQYSPYQCAGVLTLAGRMINKCESIFQLTTIGEYFQKKRKIRCRKNFYINDQGAMRLLKSRIAP